MSLLFWSLPFMIMSGCFDALYDGSDGMRAADAETPRESGADARRAIQQREALA
jgi:hypothetical protein